MASTITATTSSGIVTNADNSGVLQLASGTGNLVTIPAVTGTAMVSGNMPAFSAYASSAQTINNSTWTKVAFQLEEFDTNSCYDSATNYRFTPTVAGYYQITAGFYWNRNMTGEILLDVYKNAVAFRCLVDANAGGTTAQPYQMNGSTLVYANGTDYFEIYTYQGTGSNVSNSISSGEPFVYFQAALVRAA